MATVTRASALFLCVRLTRQFTSPTALHSLDNAHTADPSDSPGAAAAGLHGPDAEYPASTAALSAAANGSRGSHDRDAADTGTPCLASMRFLHLASAAPTYACMGPLIDGCTRSSQSHILIASRKLLLSRFSAAFLNGSSLHSSRGSPPRRLTLCSSVSSNLLIFPFLGAELITAGRFLFVFVLFFVFCFLCLLGFGCVGGLCGVESTQFTTEDETQFNKLLTDLNGSKDSINGSRDWIISNAPKVASFITDECFSEGLRPLPNLLGARAVLPAGFSRCPWNAFRRLILVSSSSSPMECPWSLQGFVIMTNLRRRAQQLQTSMGMGAHKHILYIVYVINEARRCRPCSCSVLCIHSHHRWETF